ncbi:MAG: YHS domain-containing (seleno)protein [Spirosomataceae bacterium]
MKKLAFFLYFVSIACFGQQTLDQKHFNVEKGLALQGYDAVSYFMNSPKKGKPELSYVHNGVKYQFASTANLDAFKKSPEKYEPQYGGWCAYAMGNSGEKVEVDAETYKILDGKLYLFYNSWPNNTLKSWNKNEATLKKQADASWLKLFR